MIEVKTISRLHHEEQKVGKVEQPLLFPPHSLQMSTDTEKLALLENDSITPRRQSRTRSLLRCLLPSLALFGFVYLQIAATTSGGGTSPQSRCDQVDPYVPEPNDSLDRSRDVIFGEEFREKSAGVLSGFVQVRYVDLLDYTV